MSQVTGWVKWLRLPGSIGFFYCAWSKNDIILIKKIIIKKKSKGVDIIFPLLITWFLIQLKSKTDIILIKKNNGEKNLIIILFLFIDLSLFWILFYIFFFLVSSLSIWFYFVYISNMMHILLIVIFLSFSWVFFFQFYPWFHFLFSRFSFYFSNFF
jgi:hypothetical protein